VKVWRLPEQERASEEIPLLQPASTVQFQCRTETLAWHPVADDLLAVAAGQVVTVINLTSPQHKLGQLVACFNYKT